MSVLFAGLATTVVGWDVLWNRLQDKDLFRYRREIIGSTIEMIGQRPGPVSDSEHSPRSIRSSLRSIPAY
jgi:hypothetical protein